VTRVFVYRELRAGGLVYFSSHLHELAMV